MGRVLLFGATGYTGKLTARALAERELDFVVAGRNEAKLRELADRTGAAGIRIADASDADALTNALRDVDVIVTCVGPFAKLGQTAVEAALRAGVHYVDSTGEASFVADLIEHRHEAALEAGIALAPAVGFDEVPGDVAATLACEGLEAPELVLTYAVASQASGGTLRSVLGILASQVPWLVDGETKWVGPCDHDRWAPMPPPLGPRASVAFPLAIAHVAPLHLKLRGLQTYVTTGAWQKTAMTTTVPLIRKALSLAPVRAPLERALERLPEGPSENARGRAKWTILAEARDGAAWRNVALTGTDFYGLTGSVLAAAAAKMSSSDYSAKGVLAPVQALGLDYARTELDHHGVAIDTFGDEEEHGGATSVRKDHR